MLLTLVLRKYNCLLNFTVNDCKKSEINTQVHLLYVHNTKYDLQTYRRSSKNFLCNFSLLFLPSGEIDSLCRLRIVCSYEYLKSRKVTYYT